ncbi:hypothetical protein MFFC18_06980 [Mariniblastus fucicola]|uniref:Uncharacterized protein n=1 Tax=Mariniblastus fucicola TaxID=980251 RepID=A0A5B9P2T8_9BACT|nr:hypothetical protein MFFC18_06980 [Mariniblastus fucicola]
MHSRELTEVRSSENSIESQNEKAHPETSRQRRHSNATLKSPNRTRFSLQPVVRNGHFVMTGQTGSHLGHLCDLKMREHSKSELRLPTRKTHARHPHAQSAKRQKVGPSFHGGSTFPVYSNTRHSMEFHDRVTDQGRGLKHVRPSVAIGCSTALNLVGSPEDRRAFVAVAGRLFRTTDSIY